MELELTPRTDVYFIARPGFILSLKVIAGISSSLSLIGAVVIIVSQIVLPKLWPCKYTRRIVLMLSVADALIAISHIWGISQSVEKFLEVYHSNDTEVPSTDIQCTAQAALAIFGTVAAFLWTLILAIYIFSINFMEGCISFCKKPLVIFLQDCFGWGFPLLLVMILARLYLLGYAESTDIGWCYVSLTTKMFDLKADETLIVAYELWVWLSLAGILGFSIAYLAVVYCKKNGRMCYRQDTINEADTSVQLSASTSMPKELDALNEVQVLTNEKRLRGSAQSHSGDNTVIQVDYNWRPVLAAISLLFLRCFNTFVDIWLLTASEDNHPKSNSLFGFFVIVTAIGDSLQGLVNMLLFVVCRPPVYNACKPRCKPKEYSSV